MEYLPHAQVTNFLDIINPELVSCVPANAELRLDHQHCTFQTLIHGLTISSIEDVITLSICSSFVKYI